MSSAPNIPDFKTLFEEWPGSYLILDSQLRIIAMSDACTRDAKSRREDILGKDIFRVFSRNNDDPADSGERSNGASLNRVLPHRPADAVAAQQHAILDLDPECGGLAERFYNQCNSSAVVADGSSADINRSGGDMPESLRLGTMGVEQRNLAQALHEPERTARAALDALSSHIAILDQDGRILAVNELWREFAQRNGPSLGAISEGANYLAVCDAARCESPEAAIVAAGIRDILAGETREFYTEYPCHSPTEERWFNMRVTPVPGDGPRRAVIAHENISARVNAEQAAAPREGIQQQRHRHAANHRAGAEPGRTYHPVQPASRGVGWPVD